LFLNFEAELPVNFFPHTLVFFQLVGLFFILFGYCLAGFLRVDVVADFTALACNAFVVVLDFAQVDHG
jgi:hypothetical protein